MGRLTDDDLHARVLLSRLYEPPDPQLWRRVEAIGAVRAAAEIVSDRSPLANAAALRTRLASASPDEDLRRAARLGVRVVAPGGPEWPTQLDALGDQAPLLLWVWGTADLRLLALRSVGVVGARAATAYGEAVARDLAVDLAERKWAVVSGGAFGIDAAAHRGALDGGGVTACVLAGGVDVPYPRAHHGLLSRICEGGVLVSESAPGAESFRTRFLARNRLIAALTRAVVVVEAAVRSGTMTTVRWAGSLNRPVLGVPGPVTSPASAGVHRLIREARAELVTCADEILEVVGAIGDDLAAVAQGPVVELDRRSEAERRVFDALPLRRPADVDDLCIAAGLPAAAVLAALGVLEGTGLARRRDHGWLKAGGPVSNGRQRDP